MRKTVDMRMKPTYCATPLAFVKSMSFSRMNICFTDKFTISTETTETVFLESREPLGDDAIGKEPGVVRDFHGLRAGQLRYEATCVGVFALEARHAAEGALAIRADGHH
eukprot:CAMPEP_0180579430 /NCGR_PEP_ID=MMETSP1037_2-20121125/12987_1 /TAXON_ID=632150 /ORGANISM="Azadinium spinosum, Strain 3D9" /LENGTH=108 /DNA_ID=CAMNT_0022597291 /DNA_START=360 /DNA_END=683 /DNA_ORIENTATION=+